MNLYLVRHGRPLIDTSVPASRWELDPAAAPEIRALAERLPSAADARWFSSAEPKAMATARALVGEGFEVVEALAEHRRAAGWVEDFPAAVHRAFDYPDVPAVPGWEPLTVCRDRLLTAVEPLLSDEHDVVLVGHGTAWMVLAAALTGDEPDLERWQHLRMPDVITIPR